MRNVWTKFADPVWQHSARLRGTDEDNRRLGNAWGLGRTTRSQQELQQQIREQDQRRREARRRQRQRARERKHRHDNHPVEVRPGAGPHQAEIYCLACQCHIQWLSRRDYATYKQIEMENKRA